MPGAVVQTGSMRTTTRAVALLLLTAWVGVFVAALPASAHSRLVSSSPADRASVPTSPTEIVLTFNEDINPEFVTVRVTDGEGGDVLGSDPAVAGPKVTVPVPAPIAAGSYKITYRVVSSDSHPISGSTAFTVAGDPLASPSPSAASPRDSPSAPAPAARASSPTRPTATPDAPDAPEPSDVTDTDAATGSGGTPLAVWVVVALALAGAVGATFYAIRRDRDSA